MYTAADEVSMDAQFEEPNKTQSEWLRKDNDNWLKLRGLSTQGTASEVKKE